MDYDTAKYVFCVSQKGYTKQLDELINIFIPDWKKGIRKSNQFLRNLRMLIINLLYGDIAISRDKSWISNIKSKWHTHHMFIKAQELLIKNNLVELKLGYNSKNYETGFSSRLKPTQKFKTIFKNIDRRPFTIDTSDLNLICINVNDTDEERRFKEREYIKGISSKEFKIIYNKVRKNKLYALADIKELKFKKESLRKVDFINRELFSQVELGFSEFKIDLENYRMPRNVYLSRSYTYFGTGGGRFTQTGIRNSYQQLKREIRKKYLTINGVKTSEVDFKSLHPNILFTIKGIQNTHNDIYDIIVKELIGESNKELRDVIKTCVLVLINSNSYRSFVSAMNDNYYKKVRIFKKFNLTHKDIKEAFCNALPEISEYILSNKANELMNIESDILEDILYEMAKRQILGVPLHDSIIVQEGNEEAIKEIMQRHYRAHTGFNIEVDIK